MEVQIDSSSGPGSRAQCTTLPADARAQQLLEELSEKAREIDALNKDFDEAKTLNAQLMRELRDSQGEFLQVRVAVAKACISGLCAFIVMVVCG